MTDLIKQARVTWKDIVGLLSILSGLLTQANISALGLPAWLSHALVVSGFALLAISRLAETVDNYVIKKWGTLSSAGRAELEIIYQKLKPELDKVAEPIDTELVKVEGAVKADAVKVVHQVEEWIDPTDLAKAKVLLNEAGYSVVVDPNAPVVANAAPPAPTPLVQPVATTGRVD